MIRIDRTRSFPYNLACVFQITYTVKDKNFCKLKNANDYRDLTFQVYLNYKFDQINFLMLEIKDFRKDEIIISLAYSKKLWLKGKVILLCGRLELRNRE